MPKRKGAWQGLCSLFVIISFLSVTSCGGSSGSGNSSGSSSSGVTISGTLTVPTSTLSSASGSESLTGSLRGPQRATAIEYGQISALIAIIIIPALNLLGQNNPGTFEPAKTFSVNSNVDGFFEADLDEGDVEDGDMVIIESEAGTTQIDLANIVDGKILLEETNLETTEAAGQFLDSLSESGVDTESWDFSEAEINFNPGCLLNLQNRQSQQADPEGEGLDGGMAIIQYVMAAGLADENYLDLGYDTPAELVRDIDDGNISGDNIQLLAEKAADYYGGNEGVYADSLLAAVNDKDEINNALMQVVADNDSEPSLCDDMEADSDLANETVAIMLHSDDIDAFNNIFDNADGLKAYYNLVSRYADADGNYTFVDPSTGCGGDNCLLWNPDAVLGILNFYDEEKGLAEFGDDTDTIADMLVHVPSDLSGSYEDWGRGMIGLWMDDNSVDLEQAAGYWAFQVEEGIDLSSVDPAVYNFDDDFSGASASQDFAACVADAGGCVTELADDGLTIDGGSGIEYVDDTGSACGDGICDSGEEENCPFDCGIVLVE